MPLHTLSHTHAVGYSSDPHLFPPRAGGVKVAEWRTRTTPDTHALNSGHARAPRNIRPSRLYDPLTRFPPHTSEESQKTSPRHLVSFGLDRSFTHFHYQLEELKGLELNAAFVSHSSARSLPWFLVRLQEEKFFRKLIYSVMR